jgi:UDP-N-acetylmuramate: L-alanyl-gamma-D-glutamyl-meso-diaminopimelate ligase
MDHIEYFKTFERLQEAFRGFLRLLPKDGVLLMFAEDPTNRELLKSASCDRALTFGWNEGDYQARIVSKNGATLEFDVLLQGKKLDRLRIEMFGDYNGLNALSAYALATQLGWDPRTVASALASFKGVKRRQEVIGKPNNILLIEDFAHHPTAVEQTVSSIAERFPNTRVFAVFEPRSATSCRKIFQQPYFEALKQAKTVVIVPPNAFREIPLEEQLSPSQLIEDLRNAGIDAHSFPKVDEVVAFLKREAKPEDVVLLMSNGAFGGIYQKLLATL